MLCWFAGRAQAISNQRTTGAIVDTSSAPKELAGDNTCATSAADPGRSGLRVHEYPDGHLSCPRVSGATRRAKPSDDMTRFDATEPGPVDKWRQSSRRTTSPSGPTTTTSQPGLSASMATKTMERKVIVADAPLGQNFFALAQRPHLGVAVFARRRQGAKRIGAQKRLPGFACDGAAPAPGCRGLRSSPPGRQAHRGPETSARFRLR